MKQTSTPHEYRPHMLSDSPNCVLCGALRSEHTTATRPVWLYGTPVAWFTNIVDAVYYARRTPGATIAQSTDTDYPVMVVVVK